MRKSNKQIQIVNIPIYNFGLIMVNRVVKKYSSEDVMVEMKLKGYPERCLEDTEFRGDSIATAYSLSSLRACLIINKKMNRETIAHECVHLTSYLFRGIGESHDFNLNDEHYAYILQYFYTLVEDFCTDNKLHS